MTRWRRFFQWLTASRLFGFTALAIGAGLAVWPELYDNPAYRVLFQWVTPRQAGFGWMIVGAVCVVVVSDWSTALLGSALIGWGLGLGAAALVIDPPPGAHRSGSPLGWLWFVAFGLAVLRTLVVLGPDRMRT